MKKIIRFTGGVLGYLGAAVSAVAYGGYVAHLIRDEKAETNIVTWGVWSIEATLSFLIQKRQANDDLPKYLEEVVAALGCIGITGLLIWKWVVWDVNPLGPVHWIDGVSVLLCYIVYRIYRTSEKLFDDIWDATKAFQGVIIFGALPLVRSTFVDPTGEDVRFWVLWSIGFALQTVCTVMRQDDKLGLRATITPLNYLFWHVLIALIVAGYISAGAMW